MTSQVAPVPGGLPGRHRRRGLRGKFHVGRTARMYARRVIGALAVIAAVAIVSVAAAFGKPDSGSVSIPRYQKQDNPYLHTPAPARSRGASHSPPAGGVAPGGAGGLVIPAQPVPAPVTSPATPVPTTPLPTTPAPTTPVPTTPVPTTPVPTTPAPTTPAPTAPAPTAPEPASPAPAGEAPASLAQGAALPAASPGSA